MSYLLSLDRAASRRRSVPVFVRNMTERHPELGRQVTYQDFLAIAERERIVVRVVPLSRAARLLRIGRWACIQLNKTLSLDERAIYGMHELCHFWRDDPGEACYNAEDNALVDAQEDFADVFAWVVTSTARDFILGVKDEDF